MSEAISQAEADELMARAFELLHQNQADRAFELGRMLEERQYSGAFEIQALALERLEGRPAAIQVLERGVELVPNVWLLWQLLGNFRSDEGDYEGAIAAYQRASACDGDCVSIAYNYANVLARAGQREEAKGKLRPLIDGGIPEGTERELGDLIGRLWRDLNRKPSIMSKVLGSVRRAFQRGSG